MKPRIRRATIGRIGPADHGRPIRLEEFDEAEGQEGYSYELSRGIITVVDVPRGHHALPLIAIRRQFSTDDVLHPGRMTGIMECKLVVGDHESERHPDPAIDLTPPPDPRSQDSWSKRVPELVVEIVLPSSRNRDYEEKPEEYLGLGVRESWIVDGPRRLMVVRRRVRNRWVERTVRPPEFYRTRLLPGLEFSCGVVFEAAGLE